MPDMWDRTHLIYRGTKYTVGDHAGAACVEWHLHAWDMARAVGGDYRPRDPDLLVSAWHWGVPHLPLAAGTRGRRCCARRAGRRAGRTPTTARSTGRAGRAAGRAVQTPSGLPGRGRR